MRVCFFNVEFQGFTSAQLLLSLIVILVATSDPWIWLQGQLQESWNKMHAGTPDSIQILDQSATSIPTPKPGVSVAMSEG
jgi:hypothetical protein